MKVIKMKGLKPEIVDLDYSIIKEEMENADKKGKNEQVVSYTKLLENLNESSNAEVIENEVNKIIDLDKEKIKELKSEIKRLEKEMNLLSHYSKRETDLDVSMIIANL